MTVREELERREHRILNPLAAFADQSKGRLRPEEPREMDVRTCYQRDTDRIVHSKAFRRLMHKTQVFLQPEGDHYRTRMTHTLEVIWDTRLLAMRGKRLYPMLWGSLSAIMSRVCGWWMFWSGRAPV